MDGFVASSADLSAGGVRVLKTSEQLSEACALLSAHFTDSAAEIAAILTPDELRARNCSALGLFDDAGAGALQCASLCAIKKLPGSSLTVVEIIWFGSRVRGRGAGAALFAAVALAASRGARADALLVTSTNGALPFWLSRPDVRIADSVLRSAARPPLAPAALLGFRVSGGPTGAGMERLYAETVLRNRKGRPVGVFKGKPFHYGLDESNHVWYPFNARLRIRTRPVKKRAAPVAELTVAVAAASVKDERFAADQTQPQEEQAASQAA